MRRLRCTVSGRRETHLDHHPDKSCFLRDDCDDTGLRLLTRCSAGPRRVGLSRANKQGYLLHLRVQTCERLKDRFLKWDTTPFADRISSHGRDATNSPYITPIYLRLRNLRESTRREVPRFAAGETLINFAMKARSSAKPTNRPDVALMPTKFRHPRITLSISLSHSQAP